MEKNAKEIIDFVAKGQAKNVKESLFGLLNRKLQLALNAKRLDLAKRAFSGANKDVKKTS